IESVKTVSELFAPINGTVAEVNGALDDQPELVNDSPYADGWQLVIEPSSKAEVDGLMDAAVYEAFLGTLDWLSKPSREGPRLSWRRRRVVLARGPRRLLLYALFAAHG